MTNPNITVIILDALTHMGLSPEQVNDGACAQFARAVVARYPDARMMEWGCDVDPELDRIGCHAYVVVADRCYDAEAPAGVNHPRELPFYQRKRL